ncbi:MAG TPA: MarP family serine protease [Verrucomicrobiae bacterium]|nr:MarP family serine protease [Verrucomicrobiae bacterium]
MITLADVLILLILACGAFLGMRYGFIKQLAISLGMVLGLFAIAFVYGKLAFLSESSAIRTIILGILVLGIAFLCFDACLLLGTWIRKRIWAKSHPVSVLEQSGGAIVAVVATAVVIWLGTAIFAPSLPSMAERQIDNSKLLSAINKLASVPGIFKNTAHLLDPFSSPDVFVGDEPQFDTADNAVSQQFNDLDGAVQRAKNATVKVNAWGCGSTSLGSGFLVGKRLIATNAHVIAGANRMSIQDQTGTHVAQAVWFDPSLDLAILRTASDLSAAPLSLQTKAYPPGSVSALVGYPNGQLTSQDATIMQYLSASGFDIYGKTKTLRKVYAIRSSLGPGNSGGPLINSEGQVIGMVFGHSASQNKTGYVIVADQLTGGIAVASKQATQVATGSCTGS